MASTASRVLTGVGIVSNFISCCLFLSPDFSPCPYLVTVLNCALWVYYGKITPDSLLVITINGAGLAMELIYVAFYLIYANRKQRFGVGIWSLAEIVIYLAVVLSLSLIPMPKSSRDTAIGVICDVVNIVMYGIPCERIYQVYKTKSLEYMPFWLSFVGFLNGLCWLTYALLEFDLFILTSNGTGCALGVIQLAVITYYYLKYPQPTYTNRIKQLYTYLKSKNNNKVNNEKTIEGGGAKVLQLPDMV
ncbi:hypothetical protein MKX01_013224 [Papaver californicum]|nr:hypothetical protein MKX01_013224 [Papaver californicum]